MITKKHSQCFIYFQVEDKEEFDKLLDLVKNNEVPPDAPTIPDPSTANDGKFV